MPTRIANRREEPRRRIPGFQEAEIEFMAPDGATCTRPLIELSLTGGSFLLRQRIPGLIAGIAVHGGLLRLGKIGIRAHFQVLHVSRIEGNAYVCGVRLYPASEEDRNELAGLISRLASLPR